MALAASLTIEQLLGLPALMKVVQETTDGLPQETFLPKAWKTTTGEFIGNSVQATVIRGQRKVSRVTQYNSPPVGATLETIGRKNWVAISTSEELDIDPVTFQRLREFDNWQLQKMGAEEIGRQIGLFVKKQENLVSSVTLYLLAQGVAYFDLYGNLLAAPQSLATMLPPVTMLVPATNQGQLPYGGSPLIPTPWSSPIANIPLHIRNIKKAALQATGYEPTQAFYGANIPQYIQNNSYCEEYLSRNEGMNAEFMSSGEIPQGFQGLKWIPAWKGFFEDATGVNQAIWPNDLVTFCPEPADYWYEMALGSNPVPKTIDILTNMENALSQIETVYGKFVYAQLQNKPVRLTTVMGNTFLPCFKVPEALWQAIVAGW